MEAPGTAAAFASCLSMACFTLLWLEQLIIWLIIVAAVISIIRIVVPWLTGLIGIPVVGAVIQVVLWAICAIIAVKIIFMLIACLLGGGALHLM